MTESACDFLVIGAGQNNLTAAAYIAAAGHSVTVLERHPYWGGGCITGEVTRPGFKHDLHATNIFLAQANPLLARDELGLLSRFGLRFADTRNAVSHGTVFEDGSALGLYKDLDRTLASIDRYSAHDADAYKLFMQRALKYVPLLTFALFAPPGDGRTFRSLLHESEAGRDLIGLLDSSVADLCRTHFTDARTRVHLLRLASEMMMRADAPGSGFGLMLMAGLYHTHPAGFAIGGAQAFSDALVRCIQHHGGEMVLDCDVARVEIQHGRATAAIASDGRRYVAHKAIIAALPPWRLADYVPGTEALAAKVSKVPTSDYTCFLTHLALERPPRPTREPEFQAMGFTVLAPRDFEGLVQTTRDAAEGRLPSIFTASYVCATHFDPSRAPADKHTLYLYRHVPGVLHGRPLDAWDEIKESYGTELLRETRRYLPELSPENILGVSHVSPCDIQRESPSYRNGDVAALAMTPSQFFDGRPIPELARYRVPGLDGLYLCGPFMHPGGGANGGGRALAMRVMMDLDLGLAPFQY